MIELVGYTGFVGSNIYESGKRYIDAVYNSKNIHDAYGTEPELLIYSGMRAEKYLANTNPEADRQLVYEAEKNIQKINPKKIVLISTIDVFSDSDKKSESSMVDVANLHAYGLNRYILEQWVRDNYPNSLIIRLPGLYGINIKKNFIYDYINIIPYMINKVKFKELSCKEEKIGDYYTFQDNGFYKCKILNDAEKCELKAILRKLDFSALDFTDSRNKYQFYPLNRLWDDIQIALNHKLSIWHPATEPVSAEEVFEYLSGNRFVNEISNVPVCYDYRTEYAGLFGGADGYIMNKKQILDSIKMFVDGTKK